MKLSIGDRDLLTINADGTITFSPEYTPDELALAFWEKVGRRYVEYDILYQHMESILSRIGVSDISCEKLKYELDTLSNPFQRQALEDIFEESSEQLSELIGEAVELGRGLAKRSIEVKGPPSRLPECVLGDPDSEYLGSDLNKDRSKLN